MKARQAECAKAWAKTGMDVAWDHERRAPLLEEAKKLLATGQLFTTTTTKRTKGGKVPHTMVVGAGKLENLGDVKLDNYAHDAKQEQAQDEDEPEEQCLEDTPQIQDIFDNDGDDDADEQVQDAEEEEAMDPGAHIPDSVGRPQRTDRQKPKRFRQD